MIIITVLNNKSEKTRNYENFYLKYIYSGLENVYVTEIYCKGEKVVFNELDCSENLGLIQLTYYKSGMEGF